MTEREQIWRPISWLPVVIENNAQMLAADDAQRAKLEAALHRPGVVDDALLERLDRFCAERQEILAATDRQMAKWNEECSNARDSSLLERCRFQVNSLDASCQAIMGIVDRLRGQTIEKILATPDEELGREAFAQQNKSPETPEEVRQVMRAFIEENVTPAMEDIVDHCHHLTSEEALITNFKATSVTLGQLAGQFPMLQSSVNAIEGAAQKLTERVFDTHDRSVMEARLDKVIRPCARGFGEIFAAREMDSFEAAATLLHLSVVLCFEVKEKHAFLDELLDKHLVPIASELVSAAVMSGR